MNELKKVLSDRLSVIHKKYLLTSKSFVDRSILLGRINELKFILKYIAAIQISKEINKNE